WSSDVCSSNLALHTTAEAFPQVRVSSGHLPAVVAREQHERDNDPPQQVAQRYLDEGDITEIGDGRHADHGQRARLGGDHREAHRPPRKIAVTEKIPLQIALFPGQSEAYPGRDGQVDDDDAEIEQSHGAYLDCRVVTQW